MSYCHNENDVTLTQVSKLAVIDIFSGAYRLNIMRVKTVKNEQVVIT